MSRLQYRVAVRALLGGLRTRIAQGQETQKPRSMAVVLGSVLSAPEGIRTPNLLIRSQMLYPLSYRRTARRDGPRTL